MAGRQVLVGGVHVDETVVKICSGVRAAAAAAAREVYPGCSDAGRIDAAHEDAVAEPVLFFAALEEGRPDFGVALVVPPYPAVRRGGEEVGFERERVDVGEEFVAAFYGGADVGGDLGVHPGLDNFADGGVAGRGFEAIYGEADGVGTELDPAKEELWGGLRACREVVVS